MTDILEMYLYIYFANHRCSSEIYKKWKETDINSFTLLFVRKISCIIPKRITKWYWQDWTLQQVGQWKVIFTGVSLARNALVNQIPYTGCYHLNLSYNSYRWMVKYLYFTKKNVAKVSHFIFSWIWHLGISISHWQQSMNWVEARSAKYLNIIPWNYIFSQKAKKEMFMVYIQFSNGKVSVQNFNVQACKLWPQEHGVYHFNFDTLEYYI